MAHAPANPEVGVAVAAEPEAERLRVTGPAPAPSPRRRPPAAPLFAATVAFCGGIVLHHSVYKPPLLYLLCTLGFALCSVAALWVARYAERNAERRGEGAGTGAVLAYIGAVLAFFPAGALLATAHQEQPSPSSTLLQYASGEEVNLTGYVTRSGSLRVGRALHETFDFAVEEAQFDQTSTTPLLPNAGRSGASKQLVPPSNPSVQRQLLGTVRLSLYVPGARFGGGESDLEAGMEHAVAPPLFDYGQRLRIRAKLRPPTNYRNPGSMDYVGWLHEQGVWVLGSAKTTSVEVLPGAGGSRVQRLRWKLRRRVLEEMGALWKPPYLALFQAMVLGERGLVDREQRLEFQRSGTFHLLVVSGMNVAVFAVFLLWLTRQLRVARRLELGPELAMLTAMALTAGYAWITDLGTPILRSVLMIFACQIAALLNRHRSPLNTVSLAALALLAWKPFSLYDPSFQLTFIAVLTIAGLAVPLLERTTMPWWDALDDVDNVGRDATLLPKQAQLRVELRMISAALGKIVGIRAGRWIVPKVGLAALQFADLFLLSALMQIAITLPTVWYFHRVNAHALWANMAVLPLMGLLMPAAMLAVAFSFAAHWLPFVHWLGLAKVAVPLAGFAALVARWALQGILWAVHWSGGAQLSDHRVAMPAAMAIAAVAGCYVLALLLARRNSLLTAASLALLALSAWLVIARPRPFLHDPHALEITAIDIGQGDSFLLVTPGGHTLLLDSGGLPGQRHGEFDIGEDVVSPYLWQRGLGRLDAAAFSHSHVDHIGGMRAILRNFHPRELWSAPTHPSPELNSVLETAEQLGIKRVQRRRGEEFDFDGVHISVLSPPVDWEPKPRGQDDASMVLRVSYAGHSALLVGDIHKSMEKNLVEEAERRGESLQADLLKVPHHGSNTSSSEEFLDSVQPRFAVISAGIRNPFHHPRREVIGRLAAHHARTYRTDWFGPVTFLIDAQGVRPVVER
jgi:competence protein ComEC